uniref:Photosystem II D1 processing protein PSB27-H2, chloroplastic n=1 Tax=Oryza meridionalis TaxID=40149 RepID=A0A0E0D6S8_9ORYZ
MRAMPSPPPPRTTMSLMASRCYCCSPSPPPPKQRRDAESKQKQPIRGARLAVTTRRALLAAVVVVGSGTAGRARAAEDDGGGEEGEGVVGAIKSIFDPNERTKAGKVLPKAYLKAAREVVRTLRESLGEDDGGDVAKFRRGADAAKESIREFLGGWRGQQAVAAEESYVALEKAIRSLAEFYSKAGPFASLPKDVKDKILVDLNTADAFL